MKSKLAIEDTAFTRIVTVSPAYDKRSTDKSKDYGIGSCRITFVLKGAKGAVQFMIGTNWYVPTAREHLLRFAHTQSDCLKMAPEGWDVGYHSLVPMYQGQEPMGRDCELVEGGKCFYDGSGLRADEWVPLFVAGGTDWLWPKLEEEYRAFFE